MKLYLISDNIDTLTGMRLAGIEGVVAHERQEVADAIDQILGQREIGILLLTEALGRKYPDLVKNVRTEYRQPLLIEIPDRHGTGRRPDFITSYVNEAIGLKLE